MRKRRPTETPLPGADAPQRGYNTNLASEFYVLSMLYRLGFDANLTLGNKKSVDIAVVFGPGHAITVDVKAVAGKMDWLMGSSPDLPKLNHYVVLVSYEGLFWRRSAGSALLDSEARRNPAAREDGERHGPNAVSLAQTGAHDLWSSGRSLAGSGGPW